MIKMARRLFALRPDEHTAAFHERALFNHILASMDPEDGRTCYMVPVGRGVQREYQKMFEDFTCCVGTGMESHALHGFGIYYESGNKLWVNLYAPSAAEWREAGVNLAMETDLPEGEAAKLTFTLQAPREFTLALRRPAWAGGEGFSVCVNGEPWVCLPLPGSYVEIRRRWRSGDTVELALPKALRFEPLRDNPMRVAVMWGPLVLAGDLGPEDTFEAWREGAIPALVVEDKAVGEWLLPVSGKPGHFRCRSGNGSEVEFLPFYRLQRRTYAVYFDLFTPAGWEAKKAEYAAERDRQRRLQQATVAFFQPGEMQPERDFDFQGEGTEFDESNRVQGRAYRRARQWMSWTLPIGEGRPLALVVTYFQDEWRRRSFDILVDGEKIAEQVVERGGVPHFYDLRYSVPAGLLAGKRKITVRFQATNGNETPKVFGVRLVRVE
jgi:hypothetical protein